MLSPLDTKEFWDTTYQVCGWNAAHVYFPHITLSTFFKVCALEHMNLNSCLTSGVPIGLNLGQCPIKNPKCPIVFSKPRQNVQ